MKDCKCGRRIPSDWKICGECNEMRNRVFMYQAMEGTRRREFVAERAKIAQALARKRPHLVVVEDKAPKTTKQTKRSKEPREVILEQRSSTDDAIQIDRLLQRKRAVKTMKLRRKLEHYSGKQGIKDWYHRED